MLPWVLAVVAKEAAAPTSLDWVQTVVPQAIAGLALVLVLTGKLLTSWHVADLKAGHAAALKAAVDAGAAGVEAERKSKIEAEARAARLETSRDKWQSVAFDSRGEAARNGETASRATALLEDLIKSGRTSDRSDR